MKILGFCAILSLGLGACARSGPSPQPPRVHFGPVAGQRAIGRIEYGEIGGAPLQYFVSPRLAPACKLLKEQKFSKVIPVFYEDLRACPDSLGDFVALAQASPSWRPLAQKKLEQALIKNPDSWILQSEVGTLLFYGFEMMDPNTANIRQDQLHRAEELTSRAWHSSNNPLAGQVYDEVAHWTHSVNTTPQSFFQDIYDGILRAAAGARAYEVVERAKQAGWSGPLPAPDLTPRAGLRPLLGVLIEQSYEAGVTSKLFFPGGRFEYLHRADPAKVKYLTGWMDLVTEELAAKPPAPGKK
ncbi:MAG TPA: hypothetical protein VFJ58_25730 [Armatimonadota bacterium]|nr:hypothetical protein [Armatimonadota bacterium]